MASSSASPILLNHMVKFTRTSWETSPQSIINHSNKTGDILGTLNTHDGHSYELEKCEDNYILKEFDVDSFPPDIHIINDEETAVGSSTRQTRSVNSSRNRSISVMFYYTPDFANAPQFNGDTEKIAQWIDEILDKTNQGFVNSRIPLVLTKFCQEKATINDQEKPVLSSFRRMKGIIEALRNTADLAALLVDSFDVCGIADFPGSLSVTRRDCAEGGPVFAHEIGHNLGADHNKEQGKNIHHDDGHGHFIRGGYRTIMAYSKPGYNKWINYFSNPEVSYLGSPTGVYGEANNAAVIMKNIDKFASYGDESGTCRDTQSKKCNTRNDTFIET